MRGPSMLLALGLVFGLACGSASPLSGEGTSDAMPECPIGEETCPCSSSGACIPGLSCESNVCVAPGGTGSTSGTGGTDTIGTDTTGDGSSTAPADASSSSGEPAASSSSDEGDSSSSSDGAAESSSSSSSDGAGESSSGSGSSSTT